MLEHKANVNAINPKRLEQLLHIAAYNGNMEIVKLLQNGASQKQEKGVYDSPLIVCSIVCYCILFLNILGSSSSGKSRYFENIDTQ